MQPADSRHGAILAVGITGSHSSGVEGMSYAYIWEFDVPLSHQSEFEQHYGPDGTWARLFEMSPGYIETLLLKDRSKAGRYVTLDRWRDEEAFQVFRASFSAQYEYLDRECERLALTEQLLGVFTECTA